jgi:hypothetical protein
MSSERRNGTGAHLPVYGCNRFSGHRDFFRRLAWVLEPYRYHSLAKVRASLEDKIIAPATLKAKELLG